MNMHASPIRWSLVLLALLAVAGLLAGCGATSGTATGGSYGSDAGPWPAAPNRSTGTSAARPAANEPPTAPLYVVLRGKSADADTLKLALAAVEVKFEDSWTAVATKHLITTNETLPLGEWTAAEGKANLITLTIDGSKVTRTDTSATLPTEALTVATGLATGGISGKMIPALPTARVEVFLGSNTTPIAGANPTAEDGTFTIDNLPPGSYRVAVRAPGHRLIEPLTDPVAVEAKVVPLRKLEMTAN